MSLNRYAKRRDKNERELIDVARAMGVLVKQAPPLDLWAYIGGKWVPVEVKDGNAKLTEAEQRFIDECHAKNAPYRIWREVDDIVKDQNYEPRKPL